MLTGTDSEWRWVSLSPLPVWALVAAAFVLCLAAWFALSGLRQEPTRWKRRLLMGLRLCTVGAAALLLLEPGLRRVQVSQVRSRAVVLIDRSASMGFPTGPGGPRRLERAAEWARALQAQTQAGTAPYRLEWNAFGTERTSLTTDALLSSALSPKTDILNAFRSLKAENVVGSSQEIAGVVLVSDGADNVHLVAGLNALSRRELNGLGFPVSTVLVGEDALKDLAIEDVRVDDFAFVRNSFSVDVEVRGRGFGGRAVPVTLKREGQIVGVQEARLQGPNASAKLRFTLTPDRTGRFVYTVGVPVFPDEAVQENNQRSFVVKVIRDRVRVLLVVGQPSWDERFLRARLKSDANVDLVSFYILRTQSDDPRVSSDRELSLIPFPMEEIFDAKLGTFDVVIFQNFGRADPALSIAAYERNLEAYISGGGAFVVVGGEHAFGSGQRFPILGQALPVEAAALAPDEASFVPQLTVAGERHPVTAWLANRTEKRGSRWTGLPALDGLNLVRAREGASVLLEHPSRTLDGKPAPLVVAGEYGRGRVLVVASDASWKWAFVGNAEGTSSRDYERFWGAALRWLIHDPDLSAVSLAADPSVVEPGQPVGAVVTVRSAGFEPVPGASVRVELRSADSGQRLAEKTAVTGQDGTARVDFGAQPAGAYQLHASATLGDRAGDKPGGKPLGEADDALAVRTVGPELGDASVRPGLMSDIAQATGGRTLSTADAALDRIPLRPAPRVEVGRSEDEPLWDRWASLAVLGTLLSLEWFLRRRFGYL
ncbi:MAG: glutamine amidotransferase [Myxococcaceae bacterium]